MPFAPSGSVQIFYETLGDPADPPLVLIAGLGNQLLMWHDEFCHSLVDRGFFVIRHDNRDAGLSTIMADEQPYSLSDMATDTVAVLDAAGVDRAHFVGHSLGGMIAQLVAIEHRARVATLTTISSSTGNFEYGAPTDEAMAAISRPPAGSIEAAIEGDVASRRIWASPSWFDEGAAREYFRAAHERSFTPGASMRQVATILSASDREPLLAQLDVPALVIHGTLDPLIPPDGGRRTAELIPRAELMLVDGLGHDLPVQVWQQVISAITAHVAAHAV